MNLFLSSLVYVIMAVLIGAGILVMIHGGGFWLLGAAVVGYFVLLIRYGCLSH